MAFFFWFILPIVLLLFRKSTNKFIPILVIGILIFYSGFRDISFVGDSQNYYIWFLSGESFFEGKNTELFFKWINIYALNHKIPFQFILFAMSFITVTFVYLSLRRVSDYVVWGLTIYILLTFYLYSYNAMRQMAADSILLYSYTFLKDKKYIIWVGLVVVAAMFHTTSWVALLLFPFGYFDKLKIPTFVVYAIVITSFIYGGLNILADSDLSFIDEFFDRRYYYNTQDDEIAENSFTLSRFLYSFFFLYVYSCYGDRRNLYLKIFLVGIVLFNLFSFRVEAMRIAYLFTPVQILLFAPLIGNIKISECLNVKIVILYLLVLYYYMTFNQFDALMDYKFCSPEDLEWIEQWPDQHNLSD